MGPLSRSCSAPWAEGYCLNEVCYLKALLACTNSRGPLWRPLYCRKGLHVSSEVSWFCLGQDWHQLSQRIITRSWGGDRKTNGQGWVGHSWWGKLAACRKGLGICFDGIGAKREKLLWDSLCSLCPTQTFHAHIEHFLSNRLRDPLYEKGKSLPLSSWSEKWRGRSYTMDSDSVLSFAVKERVWPWKSRSLDIGTLVWLFLPQYCFCAVW